jgi:hypothetical protein
MVVRFHEKAGPCQANSFTAMEDTTQQAVNGVFGVDLDEKAQYHLTEEPGKVLQVFEHPFEANNERWFDAPPHCTIIAETPLRNPSDLSHKLKTLGPRISPIPTPISQTP